MSKNGSKALLLKFRNKDTAFGVSRATWKALADQIGLSETEAIHVAMSRFARERGLLKMDTVEIEGHAPEFEGLVDPAIKEETLEETSMLGVNWSKVRKIAAEFRQRKEAADADTNGGRSGTDAVAGC